MSLIEILHEIESLPPEDRWQVLKHTRNLPEPEIPAEFKEGMEAIARGETLDLDEAMPELGRRIRPFWNVIWYKRFCHPEPPTSFTFLGRNELDFDGMTELSELTDFFNRKA